MLKIHQERDIKNCTGGIVWETAFLLGTFLEQVFPVVTTRR